jgi:hypothetical protein
MPETLTTAVFQYPANCVEQMPDVVGRRYRFPFHVRSDSNPNKRHVVSYDNAPGAGYWTCSCRGGIMHGHCRHLDAAGLWGRKFGRAPLPGKEATPKMFPPMRATGVRRLAEHQARKAVVSIPDKAAVDKIAQERAEAIFAAGATDDILEMLK